MGGHLGVGPFGGSVLKRLRRSRTACDSLGAPTTPHGKILFRLTLALNMFSGLKILLHPNKKNILKGEAEISVSKFKSLFSNNYCSGSRGKTKKKNLFLLSSTRFIVRLGNADTEPRSG